MAVGENASPAFLRCRFLNNRADDDGGAALIDRGRYDETELFGEMTTIGNTVREILKEAAEHGESPVAAAERRVHDTLTRARES